MDIINLYAPLLNSVIKRFSSYAAKLGLDYDDLYQEAVIALLKANRKYDASKGMKLETYIYQYIKWHLYKLIEKNKKHENVTSLYVEVGQDTEDLTLEDLIADDTVNTELEIENKIMIQTYKEEIQKHLEENKAEICILRWFNNCSYEYISKVTNNNNIYNVLRDSRIRLISRSHLFKNEYNKLHCISEFSNAARLVI